MPEDADAVEIDELWSFVARKSNTFWIWLALSRITLQVVGYAIGGRDEATCRRLWDSIPEEYRKGQIFTDFYAVYLEVIPEEQHQAAGKKSGGTNHIERFNLTLRQRLARLVRKSLSFSKSLLMHEVCLKLFLWRYNLEIRMKWWLDHYYRLATL